LRELLSHEAEQFDLQSKLPTWNEGQTHR